MVTIIISDDVTKDGNPDLLLLGNHSDNRLKIGSIDAGYGCLLQGDGKGNFAYIDQVQSGLQVVGDVKSTAVMTIGQKKYLLIGVNNQPMQFYSLP